MQLTAKVSRPCAEIHPGSANLYPDCPACRLRIELSTDARRFRELWGEPEPVPGQFAPVEVERKQPCVHLGDVTGEMVTCLTCKGSVSLKVFACKKYGKCLPAKAAPGVQCCTQCGDYRPRVTRQVICGSRGIGDMGMMLTSCAGLMRQYPEDEVVFVLPQDCYLPLEPWVRLFGGYTRLARAPLPGVQSYRPYNSYNIELAEQRRTRCQYYADMCGTTPAIPPVNDADPADSAWAQQYRGAIVLSPWSAWPGRMWDHTSWLSLEQDLLSKGRQVVVIDNESNRCDHFSCPKIVGQSAGRIAALFRVAALVVANQSGMSVISCLLGTKTLILNGQIHGHHLYAEFPSATWIDGHLTCGDCHWRGPEYERKRARCDVACESLHTISAREVASKIAELLCWRKELSTGPASKRASREITITTPQGLGDTLWCLQSLLPRYDRVNVNIAVVDGAVTQHATRAAAWLEGIPGVGSITAEAVSHDRYLSIATTHHPFPTAGGAVDFALNAPLESGLRLEAIYPDHPVQWDLQLPSEYTPRAPRGDYILCYVSEGSMYPGNCRTLGIWTPAEWAEFLRDFRRLLALPKLVFLGSAYDRQALECVARLVSSERPQVFTDFTPAETTYLIKRASFFVGYQSGLNVVADQMATRQLMLYFPPLWRMGASWVTPDHRGGRFRHDVFRRPADVLAGFTTPWK